MKHTAPHTLPALLLAILLSACSQSDAPASASAAASTAPPAAAPAALASADPAGEKTFKATCALCHATGAGGAPMTTDKADWATRIAQGNDTLYKHAIEGYVGKKGAMPARGAAASLSDAEVKAAVDYMVSKAQ